MCFLLILKRSWPVDPMLCLYSKGFMCFLLILKRSWPVDHMLCLYSKGSCVFSWSWRDPGQWTTCYVFTLMVHVFSLDLEEILASGPHVMSLLWRFMCFLLILKRYWPVDHMLCLYSKDTTMCDTAISQFELRMGETAWNNCLQGK